jgi:hypothetical protein
MQNYFHMQNCGIQKYSSKQTAIIHKNCQWIMKWNEMK